MSDAALSPVQNFDLGSIKVPTMNPITAFLSAACIAASAGMVLWNHVYIAPVFVAAAVVIALSLKMANVWEKFVIWRMGKLQSVKGAGIFVIILMLDRVIAIIGAVGRAGPFRHHGRSRL